MITRFITLAALFLLPLIGSAQCQASFNYTSNGSTFTFDGMVAPAPSANAQYYWWFSDNNTSATVQDPVHTFSAAGTYVVCFSVYDQSTNCIDSLCQSVTVAGGCNADFTFYDSLNNVSFFSSTTAPGPAQYVWDFGDGNYSNAANPNHTYATAGTYTVCLLVYDAQQNFCDSTCHVVTTQGPVGCQANFMWIDSLPYVFFFGSSTLGPAGSYLWDFGDGNYSSQMNPSHVYAAAGNYMVCLTVYDSMQNFCDSTCYTVQVATVGMTEAEFLQSLNASPNPADDNLTITFATAAPGIAVITLFDASGRVAGLQNVNVTSAGSNRTDINTTNLSQGIYLVKIVVNGNAAWTRVAITHQ